MGTALALCLSAPTFAAPDLNIRQSMSSAADRNYRSCKTLISCVGILERHAADSFDYAILAQDFDYFGEKSQEVLWRMIDAGGSGDKEADILAHRALDILSRSPKILPPAMQRRVTELWTQRANAPYPANILARLMVTNLSPMMRSTAIQTLGSRDPDVASLSRSILSQALQRQMKFPMRPADFAPLSRAAVSTPSPELTALIALYPAQTAAPVLAQILKSGHSPSVIRAYGALYKENPEAAFKTLVDTLYGLGPTEAKAAIGIGGLLAHRHPLREDGFYMNFASELSQDGDMSKAGRAAGFDALLRRQGETGVPAINDTPQNRANYALALTAFSEGDVPPLYFNLPHVIKPQNPDLWLAPLRSAAARPDEKIALTETAGHFSTPLAKNIAAQAIASRGDYRLTTAGILAKTAQAKKGDIALSNQLSGLSRSHPFTLVRAAAVLASDALKSASPRETIFKRQNSLAKRASTIEPRKAYCKTGATNLRDMARAMPYYDPAILPGRLPADRVWLTSGARAGGGWLAGYSRPGAGGLVIYNNNSGKGRELFAETAFGPQAVIAVHPTQKVPLGQTAGAFWVFASSLSTGQSAIYRAAQTSGNGFAITRHAALPAQPTSIKLTDRGEIIFAMGDINPPLTLSTAGELRRTCGPQTPLEKTPS